MSSIANPRPASTLAPLREWQQQLQVLLVQRHRELRFAAGAWVFPGGVIDAEDQRPEDDPRATALRAAIRELREETQLSIDVSRAVLLSHWTTPAVEPRRFSTWIFAAPIADLERDPCVDGSEIVAAQWVSPADALAQHRDGKLFLMPPTLITLRDLARFSRLDDLLAASIQRDVPQVLPVLCHTDEGAHLLLPGDVGYDAADPGIAGAQHRVVLCGKVWNYHCDPHCGPALDRR